ncbi:hypothetical protein HMPREF1870_01116, partial [Bacteroidales bacterium KA00344]
RLRHDRTEYKTRKRGNIYVAKADNKGENIALFALVGQKIIIEKW